MSPLDGSPDGGWVRSLTGTGAHEPAVHAPLLARAHEVLGPSAVAWGVDIGHAMTRSIIEEVPELGGSDDAFETLRMGAEAAALRSMIVLLTEDVAEMAVSEESLEGDRNFVRRGIPLDKVLRGIRLGHSLLVRTLLGAVTDEVPLDRMATEMARTSELLFAYVDAFSTSMSQEYLSEHNRWVTSAAAERAELVRTVLAGGPIDVETASDTLRYPIDRYHRALVLWHADPTSAMRTDLQRLASRLLARSGCGAVLVIPHGAASVWVWASWRTDPAARPAVGPTEELGIRMAIGSLGKGVDGFRQSHLEAARTADFVRGIDGGAFGGTPITWYADVELAVLLSRDPDLARAFVAGHLGPLSTDTPDHHDLRRTLATYLACDRGLARAGELLHIARNTVAYRVKKVERLLGRDLHDHRLELECALRLADHLGDQVLEPPH